MRDTSKSVLANGGLTKFFNALSNEARRGILELLAKRERNVKELTAQFDLQQTTISRHLHVLVEADLVRSERRGQHVFYSLERGTVKALASSFFDKL